MADLRYCVILFCSVCLSACLYVCSFVCLFCWLFRLGNRGFPTVIISGILVVVVVVVVEDVGVAVAEKQDVKPFCYWL